MTADGDFRTVAITESPVWSGGSNYVIDSFTSAPTINSRGQVAFRAKLDSRQDFTYGKGFEQTFIEPGVSVEPTAPRAPNQNAFVESWIQASSTSA